MKRSFLFEIAATAAGTGLIAATYGLVRLAYGLMLPDVRASLGMDAATAGAISSGASLAYCVGALLALVAASRSVRSFVVAASLTAGLGAIGMAAAPGTGFFAVAAVVSSAGAGLASPALVAIIARVVAAARVDAAQSAVNAGTGIGLVGAGLGALVLLPDWRTAWAISGGVTLLFGAVVLAVVHRASRTGSGADAPPVSHPSGAVPARTTGDATEPDRPGADIRGPRAIPPLGWFREHTVVIVAAALMGATSAAVWNSGRSVLTDAGVSRTDSIVAWITIGLGGIAVIATARACSRIAAERMWTLTAGAVAVGTVALVLAPSVLPVALVACAVFGWGYTAGTGALIAWTSRIDRVHAPAGTAMLFVLLVLGQAVGALVAGLAFAPFGTTTVFVGAGVVAVVAAILPSVPTVRRSRPDAALRTAEQRGTPT